MSATGDETDTRPQPESVPPRRNDHLLLWVVLMLGLLAASIWWLLSQPWTGATSGAVDRVVVVPDETPSAAPESTPAPDESATGSGKHKAAASAGAGKSAASKKTAARTRNAQSAAHLSRNAHPLAGNPPPRYPPAALRSGIEGNVLIRAEIDADGTPTEVGLARRSGNRELDRAALSAVRNWRFQPALRDGKPVASAVQVPVAFVLEDERGARR